MGRQMRAVDQLKQDLADAIVLDTFKVGTVVRWRAAEIYNFAAIKTPVGWYTTSQRNHRLTPGIVDYGELVEILAGDEVDQVMVATEWAELR